MLCGTGTTQYLASARTSTDTAPASTTAFLLGSTVHRLHSVAQVYRAASTPSRVRCTSGASASAPITFPSSHPNDPMSSDAAALVRSFAASAAARAAAAAAASAAAAAALERLLPGAAIAAAVAAAAAH